MLRDALLRWHFFQKDKLHPRYYDWRVHRTMSHHKNSLNGFKPAPSEWTMLGGLLKRPLSPQCPPCSKRTRRSSRWPPWWCVAGAARWGRCWWHCSSLSPGQWSPDACRPPLFSGVVRNGVKWAWRAIPAPDENRPLETWHTLNGWEEFYQRECCQNQRVWQIPLKNGTL